MTSIAKNMSIVLGWILIVVGLIGFAAAGFLYMHLNAVHNIVLIVTGLISLYFGYGATESASRGWCIFAGLVYSIISVIGLFSGPGTITVTTAAATDHLLKLVPGSLEFSTADNWWQLLAGVLFLIGGFSGPEPVSKYAPSGRSLGQERSKEEMPR